MSQRKAPAFASAFPAAPEPLEVAIYDNHSHLDFVFDEELGAMPWNENLDIAQSVGIRGVVQVGVTLESSKWSAELATKDVRVLAAVALHPNEAPLYENLENLNAAIQEIEALATQPRVRAIGETGLDFFRTEGENSIALQQHSFEEHIRIAKENDIALMIHDRDAHDDVVATLKRVGAPEKVVFHCYSGDTDLAQICADNGWYMSFAGNITIKRNQHLRDSLAMAPKELILIETDAPFLAPEPFRGRPNSPYLVPVTARFMAEVRGEDLNQLCAQLARNTECVYGSWQVGF
ncbi:TatD family hydrolase [Rhodoluna lacicola]|jgi:TatD DNase family protein|uniref:Hydrolase, TatD family n=1 Tax=Rhodoluna lacicola TaxID=529884 RepID=A0A060JGG6_9MICO|nr:TatD family hydrolase [Rhodoluna lacicola]AIC47820.1 hydrolase, TatD family [Rhodoluna lacicola]